MSTLFNKLLQYANNNLNVLIIGQSGVGKTTVAKKIAETLNLKFKYYSTPTLDPWVDLVGLPVPNNELETIELYRLKELENTEFLFYDEINRAHPKVLNAILEIVQFKSINGEKLPNLRMIWAAMNPPGGEYQVEDLDPVLVDRFHVYVEMKPSIDESYMKTVMKENTLRALSDWWHNDCDEKQRHFLSPRRIEYIGKLIDFGVSWKDAIPLNHTFPEKALSNRLEALNLNIDHYRDLDPTRENILSNVNRFMDKIKDDSAFSFKIKNVLVRFNADDFYAIRDLLETLPPDIVNEIGRKKMVSIKKKLEKLFEENKVDISKYPKIFEAFFSDKSF